MDRVCGGFDGLRATLIHPILDMNTSMSTGMAGIGRQEERGPAHNRLCIYSLLCLLAYSESGSAPSDTLAVDEC